MSGGFFRGTSADQDTRFSNKQAKLLKSQKFASELDHLVDMTKVKMDVMMPWIANRVTELLGFEDEVLINFIYGLLDGKEVNGKEVQISLTGFMEKNTGKFMKELWTLLLSAQGNASGVPQQLLDAKEELTRKNKAERERIANEIQKKKEKEKEGRELEQEKMRKMDGEVENLRANDTGLEPISKHPSGDSSVRLVDEKQTNARNGSRGKSRVSRSPRPANNSPSSPRGTHSRSISKSFSNSRSYSGERHRSRSTSGSPQPRGHSISAGRVHHSPSRRSVTPRRRRSPWRSLSPWARGPSRSRRRSTSHSRRRSPSPVRRRVRSPLRRGSRSPRRYRSRSPMQHRLRSPIRRRSRSPIRHRSRSASRRRSPLGRRGSPSPIWHRPPSPVRRRSPSPVRRRPPSIVRRRSPSPMRRKSPSPVRRRYRRSPSTPWRRSPSPVRHRSRRSITPRRRSPSPQEWSSGSPIQPASLSPARRVSPKRRRRSPVQSPGERTRAHEKVSPIRHATSRDQIKHSAEAHKVPNSGRQPHSSRSPRRDPRYRYGLQKKLSSLSPSPYKSPSLSKSPPRSRRKSPIEDKRLSSPYESPVKQTREPMHHISSPSPRMGRQHKPRDHSPATSGEDEESNYARELRVPKLKASEKRSPPTGEHKETLEKLHYQDEYSAERLASERPSETRSHIDSLKLRKIDTETKSDRTLLHPEVRDKSNEKTHSRNSNDGKGSNSRHRLENASKSSRKVEPTNKSGSLESDSGESNKHRAEVNEKRKHKRSERQEMASDDDYSTDSQIEERKEAKRRRKEEKRFRKDERRRRREERRRRREERRAEKLKKKSVDTASLRSDFERDHDDYASDPEHIGRRKSHASDTEETESEQKKLEIELRRKALESLRAKKGVGH